MRLFVAIPLPEAAQHALLQAQAQLPERPAVRLAHAFHLTLKFLGELDPLQVQAITSQLSPLRFASFTLTLDGIGAFPSWHHPNVLWVGCQQSAELQHLSTAVSTRLKGFGKPDDHPFQAHLTLARVDGKLSEEDIAQIRQIPVKPVQLTIDRVILYHSTLTPEGPVYREIATVSAVS